MIHEGDGRFTKRKEEEESALSHMTQPVPASQESSYRPITAQIDADDQSQQRLVCLLYVVYNIEDSQSARHALVRCPMRSILL
jgi:hypothetical protein